MPYIKVVDIKNWRVNENPKYFIPDDEAARLRRGRPLQAFDLVTPTRASKNIGLLGVVMPWQTHAILTREIAVLRSLDPDRLSNWLLLVMMSLKVVNDQFKYLVMMQMNREDLGDRLLELRIPIPRTPEGRGKWEGARQELLRGDGERPLGVRRALPRDQRGQVRGPAVIRWPAVGPGRATARRPAVYVGV